MLSVLIPAYNEEATIAATVAAVCTLPEVGQVLVVDDGSADATAARAEEAGAQVLRLETNGGKGAALNAGVPLLKGDPVALLDADLGDSAAQLHLLAEPVLAGTADLTIATFPHLPGSGGFGLVKGLAKRGIRSLTGLEVEAPLSGQRVMRRAVLESVLPFAAGYGVEVAITVKAARSGFRIKEVATTMHHSVTGRDLAGFSHRGRQFWHVLLSLIRFWR